MFIKSVFEQELDWIIGDRFDGKNLLDDDRHPTCPESLDAPFDFSTVIIPAIRKYLLDLGYDVRYITVCNITSTDLQRGPSARMASRSRVLVVEEENGLAAYYFIQTRLR